MEFPSAKSLLCHNDIESLCKPIETAQSGAIVGGKNGNIHPFAPL